MSYIATGNIQVKGEPDDHIYMISATAQKWNGITMASMHGNLRN